MSRGIGQLQRKILAFAYATNKAINGGEYRPPFGIFKVWPEGCWKSGRAYICTDESGDLHQFGAMAHLCGLKRQDPNKSWKWKTAKMTWHVEVRPGKRSWIDRDDPRWHTAASKVYRAIANLKSRQLIADRETSDFQLYVKWGPDDREACKACPRVHNQFKYGTPPREFHFQCHYILTPTGVEIARNEPPLEFDFEELFGFKPESLGVRVEATR